MAHLYKLPPPDINDWLAELAANVRTVNAFRAAIIAAQASGSADAGQLVRLHHEADIAVDRIRQLMNTAQVILEQLTGQDLDYGQFSDLPPFYPPPLP